MQNDRLPTEANHFDVMATGGGNKRRWRYLWYFSPLMMVNDL
ncbi:conserved hypothetical protein [delta proteobacterium NaphS2]|nr:conserved hypothetical protein [delta proteobacterium NaphS2]